jgi:hypothetical protein
MMRLAQRVGLALAVAVVAVLCLSSPYLAGAIGLLTAAIVAVDMIAFSKPRLPAEPEPAHATPEKISVDLNRRP